jgi:hypothetical protein
MRKSFWNEACQFYHLLPISNDDHWFSILTLFCKFIDDNGHLPRKRKSANAIEKSLAHWRYRQASIFADDGFENEMRKSLWDEACQFYEK